MLLNYIKNLSILSRRKKILLQLQLDMMVLILSLLTAVFFRFDSFSFASDPYIWMVFFCSILVAILALWQMRFYYVLVRFINGRIIITIAKAIGLAAVFLYFAGLLLDLSIPATVVINFSLLAFLGICLTRFAARSWLRVPHKFNKEPVIIYGAGEAGRQLQNALFYSSEYVPVAMIDDAPHLNNMSISGLRVHNPDKLKTLAYETGANVILLALPSVTRARRSEILEALSDQEFEIKTVPTMSDIVSGKAQVSELMTVAADDLLGRDPVLPNTELLSKNIAGRVVMVSGAGGSIGSELCKQIITQRPSVLILYEMSEFALYTIESEITSINARLEYETKIVAILGSVQHKRRLEATIDTFKVQTIFHAAAYKHVPLVEENIAEGIRNNVFGTLAITNAARKHGVESFILISTDKAVRPTSIMGASKRVAELICQAQAQETSTTCFSMVRFGNVLGSSGSVIPRFLAQIKAGGPVTVTHKDITRYFMTIPEAAQLVIQAGALGKGGDVFVLDMGQPVKILDLAFSIIKFHGLHPLINNQTDKAKTKAKEGCIEVRITGLRKGEKLFEELLIGNNPEPTVHPRIMTASETALPFNVLIKFLDRLDSSCETFNLPEIISILGQLPIDYTPGDINFSDLRWNASQNIEVKQTSVSSKRS